MCIRDRQLEGNHSSGYGNYGEALFAQAWFDKLQPLVKNHFLLGASRSGHYFWHIYSRMNWGEPWYAGFRESQTEYRLFNQKYYKRNLMPGMLGWFRMTASTTTEDIEWLMARSASYNAGFAFVTDLNTIRQNGASDQIFSILNTWENARLERKFSASLMEKMKPLENEYKLHKSTTGELMLTPVYSSKLTYTKKKLQPGQPSDVYKRQDNIWASLEVFNIIDRANIISYLFVKDFSNTVYLMPNRLTPRLLNFKIVARW